MRKLLLVVAATTSLSACQLPSFAMLDSTASGDLVLANEKDQSMTLAWSITRKDGKVQLVVGSHSAPRFVLTQDEELFYLTMKSQGRRRTKVTYQVDQAWLESAHANKIPELKIISEIWNGNIQVDKTLHDNGYQVDHSALSWTRPDHSARVCGKTVYQYEGAQFLPKSVKNQMHWCCGEQKVEKIAKTSLFIHAFELGGGELLSVNKMSLRDGASLLHSIHKQKVDRIITEAWLKAPTCP